MTGIRLAFALAGFAMTVSPQVAWAQQPARTAPADDVDARLRKLEELNAKLEKQNDKLAEQNERLEKQNQLIQAASPSAAVKPDETKNLVDGRPKEKDDTKKAADLAPKEKKEADNKVADADPVFKTTWKDGFVAETANKDFRVHIGGRFQEDFGWFAPNNAVNQAIPGGFADGADIRRARLRMDGTVYDMIDFVLEYEFANSTSTVLTAAGPTTVGVTLPGGGSLGATGNGAFSTNAPTDVYFDIKHLPGENRFRVGHFKEPFSLDDYGTADSFTTFLERSTPSDSFSPNRNLGVMLWNDPFEQRVGGFVDKRHQDPVRDEAWEVAHLRRLLAEVAGQLHDARRRLVGGLHGADHLDELQHRHRVEEVHADYLLRPLRDGGDRRDRDRARVRREHGGARQHEIGAPEHVLLRGSILVDRLDHQVGHDELLGRRDARKRLVRVCATLLREALEASPHRSETALDRPRKRIVQRHAAARCGDHLRDASAHLPGADDENMLEHHGA